MSNKTKPGKRRLTGDNFLLTDDDPPAKRLSYVKRNVWPLVINLAFGVLMFIIARTKGDN